MADDAIFTTARLVIRDFRESDLPEVTRIWQDPIASRYMDDGPKAAGESAEWLARVIHHNRVVPRSAYNLAITISGVDRAIGWVGYGPSGRAPDQGTFGVGYLLDRAHWGHGYMSEVLRGVVNDVFSRLDGNRIAAWCYAKNVASARTLERAGFTMLRAYTKPGPEGQEVACLEFAIEAPIGSRVPPRTKRLPPLRSNVAGRSGSDHS